MPNRISTTARNIVLLFCLSLVFSRNNLEVTNIHQNLRLFTRPYEFNFYDWTIHTIIEKIIIRSSNLVDYLNDESKRIIVNEFVENIVNLKILEHSLSIHYSDPTVIDKQLTSLEMQLDLEKVKENISFFSPIFESIIEEQVVAILDKNLISSIDQPIPPLSFHIGTIPSNIIISRRDLIEQIESISLDPNLGIDMHENLESEVDLTLKVSSLVVPIGGLGTYPTMIGLSSSLPWMLNTVTHEWVHNWLAFHSLGRSYGLSNETRTMNETTASIVGNEIGLIVLEEFYPDIFFEYIRKIQQVKSKTETREITEGNFDFNVEMKETRIIVDLLLSEGKIEEAESYMESRRIQFWNHGYSIRKINQAYFAFYGAYADIPDGPAGEDPVGIAVRELRNQSDSLRSFLFSIAKMTTFKELTEALNSE